MLNAANEVAVAAFLEGRIPYRSLVPFVETVLAEVMRPSPATALDAVLDADREATPRAAELVAPDAPRIQRERVASSPA